MIVSLIVAMDEQRVIGYHNKMPWHMPADLKHFKVTTLGKPILMGRNTYVSIGKPLPGRHNIVLTRRSDFTAPGVTVVHSLDEGFAVSSEAAELMIIGGANVYQQAMAQVQRMYITTIHHQFVGDTYFPKWDKAQWQILESNDYVADQHNAYNYSFAVWERKP